MQFLKLLKIISLKEIKDKLFFFLVPLLKRLRIVKPRKWEISPFKNLLKELGKSGKVLEIGPFYQPILDGPNVKFFDVLDQEGLMELAEKYNHNFAHKIPFVNKGKIPFIDFVSENGDLKVIKENFDNVVSSHCIEHQPDLVQHLKDVSQILYPQGKYYLIIPDKRYCFDHFNSESTLEDVLDAHQENRIKHSLRSVITHRLSMLTHNDPFMHWKGNHGKPSKDLGIIKQALSEFQESNYINVHAWYFTPESFREILAGLNKLGMVDLQVESLIPTRKNTYEFNVILNKSD